MLIVVQLHDLCGDVGFERRVVVGELGKSVLFSHGVCPFIQKMASLQGYQRLPASSVGSGHCAGMLCIAVHRVEKVFHRGG